MPDLRGLGLSSKPSGGFDKKAQSGAVAGVLDALRIERADLVTHDIGNMVGFAFAALNPHRVRRFVLIDAPVPGIGPWKETLKNPLLWHFRFGGPEPPLRKDGAAAPCAPAGCGCNDFWKHTCYSQCGPWSGTEQRYRRFTLDARGRWAPSLVDVHRVVRHLEEIVKPARIDRTHGRRRALFSCATL